MFPNRVTGLASLLVLASFASAQWTVTGNGVLNYEGSPVRLAGFAATCMEYLLRGIGTECFCDYNYNDPSNIITALNTEQMDAIYSILLPAPQGMKPAIRLALNAGYWLNVVTSSWSGAASEYPNLSAQYQTLVGKIVTDATSRGVVVILDLHWNNDISEQQPMALKGASVGDSLTFWTQVSTQFASNPLVFYELYNEPYGNAYDVWYSGDSTYEGMSVLANAVFNQNVKGMILVAGAEDYAYDSSSLVQFASTMPANVMKKIAFVFHPYMGPYQSGDSTKTASGFVSMLQQISSTNVPVIATELGQYCCPASGSCYLYSGTYNGVAMGYVQAIFTILEEQQFSWTVWGWRPNTAGSCSGPDANNGLSLYSAAANQGQGADYVNLFPIFYPNTGYTISPTTPTTSTPTAKATTQAPTTLAPTVKTTTPAPTTSTTASPAATCAAEWAQCGGIGYASLPCCDAGYSCVVGNPYYSQCVPSSTTSSPFTASPTTSNTIVVIVTGAPSTSSPVTHSPTTSTPAPSVSTHTPTAPTHTPTVSTHAPSVSTHGPTPSPSSKSTHAPTTLSPAASCVASWGQCGGPGATGTTCCTAGDGCIFQSASYSQCVPETAPTASSSPTSSCTTVYGQCGGTGYTGLTKCCTGSTCVYNSAYYSQCLPSHLRKRKKHRRFHHKI